MIVLELNGHLSHAVPTMVCVLASYATSEMIKTESFFEMLSDFSGLDNKIAQKGAIIVRDVLEACPEYARDYDFLSLEDSTQQDLINIVKKHGRSKNVFNDEVEATNPKESLDAIREGKAKMRFIPVVDCKQNMNLLFMVRIEEL